MLANAGEAWFRRESAAAKAGNCGGYIGVSVAYGMVASTVCARVRPCAPVCARVRPCAPHAKLPSTRRIIYH